MIRLMGIALAAACLTLATGCKKDAPAKAEKPKVDWPAAPGGGAPVLAQFVKMIGEGDRRGADMRIFNYRDVGIVHIQMTLNYLDKDGKQIGDFPFATASPRLIGPKDYEVLQLGAFVPEETTRVEAIINRVEFKGDTTPAWDNPSKPSRIQIMGTPTVESP